MEPHIIVLENGIRVVFQPIKSKVAHCGFIINAGSRDEAENEKGLAHFIEHSIFKGTTKRKSHHILNRMDNVGGEINAYTTKEKTCIYASFVKTHFDRAAELLTDILFNSTFPEKEINKEKDVIIDEINSYQDSPFEQIYDDFEELVFKDHPLASNILGSINSVKSFNRNHIINFIKNKYATNQIIFSITGNFTLNRVENIVNKYLVNKLANIKQPKRIKFEGYKPFKKIINRDVYQTHCMIGNIAYSGNDAHKTTFILLNNILGGPAMNSRLNMAIREKYGFTYNIESSYTTYTDIGLFSIYLGTENKYMNKSIDLVLKELKKLRDKKLTTAQLNKAKQQLIGHITLAEENKTNVMLGIGKSLLFYNKIDSLEDVYNKINNITAEDILEVANTVFNEKKLSTLIYQPNK